MPTNIVTRGAFGPRGLGHIKVENGVITAIVYNKETGAMDQFRIRNEEPAGRMPNVDGWEIRDIVNVYLELSPDQQDIIGVRPADGSFNVEFVRIGRENRDGTGLFRLQHFNAGKPFPGAKWDNPDHNIFYVLYRIVAGGVYSNMIVMDRCVFEFEINNYTNTVDIVQVANKRKWHEHLMGTLVTHGFNPGIDSIRVGTPEDILEYFEDLFLNRSKGAQLTLKNGWVEGTSVRPLTMGYTLEGLRAGESRADSNPVPISMAELEAQLAAMKAAAAQQDEVKS